LLLKDSVRSFLQRNKLGQYSEENQRHLEKENDPEGYFEEAQAIKVGDRCEVNAESKTGMPKRGTVKYVGKFFFFFFFSIYIYILSIYLFIIIYIIIIIIIINYYFYYY